MKLKNKLFIFAQTIPDFRLNRKKLYPSENIVFITILAVICGAETWEEIWIKQHPAEISRELPLLHGCEYVVLYLPQVRQLVDEEDALVGLVYRPRYDAQIQ